MALVHSSLYKEEDFSRIDLGVFARNLIRNLIQVYQKDVEIRVQTGNLSLDVNNAVPCGLIINELVTNALKHAFAGNRRGLITIEFREVDDRTRRLTVEDDGDGLPDDFDVRDTKSLGIVIVKQLIDQIDGVLSIVRGKGTKFQITFPVSTA
jgi:two-component sensor histidine kinase